jgi:hypothetical protein
MDAAWNNLCGSTREAMLSLICLPDWFALCWLLAPPVCLLAGAAAGAFFTHRMMTGRSPLPFLRIPGVGWMRARLGRLRKDRGQTFNKARPRF